jgi:hypothetical protein
LASNNLGELVLPEGWSEKRERFDGKRQDVFTHADGTKQIADPSKPEGIIAIANAIPDMGALSKLDVSNNCTPSAEEALLKAACDTKGVSLAL